LSGAVREMGIYEEKPDVWDLTLKWYNEQVEDAYVDFRSFLANQMLEDKPPMQDPIAEVRKVPSFRGGACVVTGPSGVGKSTLIKKLTGEFPTKFGFSVSHTTRDPRPGETDGIDYHFVTKEEMQRDIAAGLFIEHAEVHGNFYGTSIAAAEDVTKQGMVCLLDIDVQGADSVRQSKLASTTSFVFFAPPTTAVLEQRLRGRGTETEEKVQKRLSGAVREMGIYEEKPDVWDLTLKWYNEQVEDAYVDFRNFLTQQMQEDAESQIPDFAQTQFAMQHDIADLRSTVQSLQDALVSIKSSGPTQALPRQEDAESQIHNFAQTQVAMQNDIADLRSTVQSLQDALASMKSSGSS